MKRPLVTIAFLLFSIANSMAADSVVLIRGEWKCLKVGKNISVKLKDKKGNITVPSPIAFSVY